MTEASADLVTLVQAHVAQAPIIQCLAQLYTHDFSEYWVGTSKGELHPDGKFDAYPLEEYWLRPNWSAFLIMRGVSLAGFALVNDQTHSGLPANRNVGEFFIARKHRGQGVGQRAAAALCSLYPGSWEIAVARKNLAGYKFWRRSINGASRAKDIRELDAHTDQWDGPIFRFEWQERAGS